MYCTWSVDCINKFQLPVNDRPDTLDPALMRPGRMDRKVEFGLPDLEVISMSDDPVPCASSYCICSSSSRAFLLYQCMFRPFLTSSCG